MLIQKAHIRNVAPYLEGIGEDPELRIVAAITDANRQKLGRLGFSDPVQNGETILPLGVGAVSRFNADGRWQVHRDEPKEERYVRTVRWRWTQWRGRDQEEMEDFKDIYRLCYPRSFIEPPAIELTYTETDAGAFVIGPVLVNRPDQHDAVRHCINLLLELFGECELMKRDMSPFELVRMRRVTWKMLPEGAHPWPRLERHLTDVLKRYSDNTRAVIFDRQQTILSHHPDELFVGTGGFSDYIAYVFPQHRLVILECIRCGNAIYAFGQDWEQFTKLTKAEVISAGVQEARIVHTEGWKERLARLLDGHDAARAAAE
jgi:hypothetical protein